ncbi:hypothetical protein C8Q74DRAFT_1194175, partial [Fomes fomentarius]
MIHSVVADLELPRTSAEGNPHYYLGNPYEQRAAAVLNRHRPYWEGGSTDLDHEFFLVHQVSDTRYVVENTALDFELYVSTEELQDGCSDLPNMYRAALRAERVDGDPEVLDGSSELLGDVLAEVLEQRLNESIPYPDRDKCDNLPSRFRCFQLSNVVEIQDNYLSIVVSMDCTLLEGNPYFDFRDWYVNAARRMHAERLPALQESNAEIDSLSDWSNWQEDGFGTLSEVSSDGREGVITGLELNAVRPAKMKKAVETITLQRNAAVPRDLNRVVPDPIVVVVHVNGHPARALLDTGSLSDFISNRLAHQLKVLTFELAQPIPLTLAVQGSRAKINYGCTAEVEYQNICAKRYFDVANLLNYDVILGTPFFFQHRVLAGLNPTRVIVGSNSPLPVEGKQVRVLESRAASVFADHLDAARQELRQYAQPICMDASDSPLPPLRAINHTIPLKDESKIYSWRPSRCPDALRALWIEKRDAYVKS